MLGPKLAQCATTTLALFAVPLLLLIVRTKIQAKDEISLEDTRLKNPKRRRKGRRKNNKKKAAEPKSSPNNINLSPASFPRYLLKLFGLYDGGSNGRYSLGDETTKSIKFVAMDCEMVGYGRKGINSMLARCSLVAIEYGDAGPRIKVLYDAYVKPTKNITDYRTKWSGITPAHLESANAVTFDRCRSKVISLLKSTEDQEVILVGHALKNDFQVLRYWHPRRLVRDTACFKPFMNPVRKRMYPKKLSFLAEEHLGIRIQNNDCQFDIDYGECTTPTGEHVEGHSSIEDAAAALMLYNKFSDEWEEKLRHPLGKQRKKWQ